ncbi:NADPH:quinone reductase-like Zn-dependent oxidoreductase [Kribbella orskensis]|uniref:NADPH:quinone reductase-like Zn-dependent oxidoreductase n=1 Tax=Kribbella orskensis TaxID=2512216 RepID=A0ABY2BS61_9ACTN|nr:MULTISPECIES: NADP-dependent oxidoreductase [Kribbella]TCN37294.1 NADPH:quinone reductase-like Zn-dependent oxidoreductase [Kribbella sp. VKM Ac-2500]TCO27798.1 NADPH:quinone reductase-like Zn-dependent oxidoreductase [Kribbella orskensis]
MARALAIAERDEKPAIQEVPAQIPEAGQVRVAVEAASVNGIDAATAAGYLWDLMPHTFPVTLGRDFAGLVQAVGDGVTNVQVGDRVAGVITGMALGKGAIADSATVDAGTTAVIPEAVSSAQAAGLGLVGLTATALLDALKLTADDTVLVSGATGGVGAVAVQLAAATGAKVIGTARPGAAEFVRGLGAHEVVDYTADLGAAVQVVAPDGVTAVVHAAGDPATLAGVLQPGGRLASALGATPEQAGRDDVTVLTAMADATSEQLTKLLEATANGSLQVPVFRTYTFDEAHQAVTDFGNHKLGKLVIIIR